MALLHFKFSKSISKSSIAEIISDTFSDIEKFGHKVIYDFTFEHSDVLVVDKDISDDKRKIYVYYFSGSHSSSRLIWEEFSSTIIQSIKEYNGNDDFLVVFLSNSKKEGLHRIL